MPQGASLSSADIQRKLRLFIPGVGLTFVADEVGGDRQFDATVIREGVFQPGIGNPQGDRIFFPANVIARMAPSFEGKPINLEHSREMNDEVGTMGQMRMDDEGVRLRSTLVVQKKRPRYMDAIGFIESRQAAKLVPNVSIEVGGVVLRPAQPGENYNGQPFDYVLVDAVGEGCAILPRGACSDAAGCGIGLTAHGAPGSDFQVLALQGIDIDHKETHKMCADDKAQLADLQAKHTALETANAQMQKDLAAKSGEVTSLKADLSAVTESVKAMEAADLEALHETVQAAAPKGTDLKAVMGEKPTKEVMLATLKAFRLQPQAAPATPGQPNGRQTVASTRSPGGVVKLTAEQTQAHKEAMKGRYAALGLAAPGTSKLPPSMQRNTARVVEDAAVEAATAQ